MKNVANEKSNQAARLGMATAANQESDRKRKATPANQESARKRMANPANRESARLRRIQMTRSYKAWYLPNTQINVDKLELPSLDYVCSSCGAQMFQFEFHRKQKDGSMTFSLCCGYGR